MVVRVKFTAAFRNRKIIAISRLSMGRKFKITDEAVQNRR